MNIRPEEKQDFAAIYELVKSAFETAPVTDGDEQEFVNQLRKRDGYVPELALVAEEDGKLIGHIMFTEIQLEFDGKPPMAVLLVAPLCVELSCRDKGIGGKLMNAGFERARKLGYTAAFLAGDPGYYNRFGFRRSMDFGIQNTAGIPDMYALACELVPGALEGKAGFIAIQ